jgi:copper oxidase (laccase) domain-containing protein
MEKISFDVFSELELATFTKEAPSLPTGDKVVLLTVTAEKRHPLIVETSDEIPFFFYDKPAHLIGAARLTKEETLTESLKADMHRVIVQYNLVPSDIVIYMGPCLTFSHTVVERPLLLKVMDMGYRAAAKRTSGVDFFDVPILNVIMLRNLGIPAKNIYLDAHDTFECDKLFYSSLRGDKKKNVSIIELLK